MKVVSAILMILGAMGIVGESAVLSQYDFRGLYDDRFGGPRQAALGMALSALLLGIGFRLWRRGRGRRG